MEEINLLEKSVIEALPQVPYVIDQAGNAMKWAKEELNEGDYFKTLKRTLNVIKYAAKVSEGNFFKTHLVMTSLLKDIPNVLENEKFSAFDNVSKTVEKSIKATTLDENMITERGCFKALSMHLVPMASSDQDLFNIMLYGIVADLQEIASGMIKIGVKTPITQQDYITILGYALVLSNISAAKPSLLNETQSIINDIRILLNNFNY